MTENDSAPIWVAKPFIAVIIAPQSELLLLPLSGVGTGTFPPLTGCLEQNQDTKDPPSIIPNKAKSRPKAFELK